MTTAMKGMTWVLAWAVLLLSVILMAEALFLLQTLQALYFIDVTFESLSPEEAAIYRRMYEYFGSFTRCFLSMFELTLANWPPVTRLLTEKVSEPLMFFCLLHKLTIGFAVVGVINGVFMQETF